MWSIRRAFCADERGKMRACVLPDCFACLQILISSHGQSHLSVCQGENMIITNLLPTTKQFTFGALKIE